MRDVATLVTGIEYKLGKLIDQTNHYRLENESLNAELASLRQVITEQKETIKRLDEKNKLLKIAKTIETKEGNVEAKLKINELVREIDKCIGILNT